MIRERGAEVQQKPIGDLEKAKKLNEQLERSGAYEQIKEPRSAKLLKTYLSTEKTLEEVGKALEKPIKEHRVRELLYVGMREAFPQLDEQTRQEYGTPEAALQTRSRAPTNEIRRRLSHPKAKIPERKRGYHLNRPRDPVTNKVIFSDNHLAHIREANARIMQSYREGTYAGKPFGRPRTDAGRPRRAR